jgi:hypothetical protein
MSSTDFKWTNRRRKIEKEILRHKQIITVRMNDEADPPRMEGRITGVDMQGRPCSTSYHILEALFIGLEAWGQGDLIQRALPFMSKDDREFIMSGMSAEDWKGAFG